MSHDPNGSSDDQRTAAETRGGYPVHYDIERPATFSRLQLAIRFLVFWILGAVGVSFGSVFALCFFALPVFAAVRLSQTPASHYIENEGAGVLDALRWLAAVCAWAGLISENPPSSSPEDTVRLEVEGRPKPTAASALWRVITGLPSAFVLAILGFLGAFVWVWAALSILFFQRVGRRAFSYLVGLQRWSIRLLAYQASLVDEYPPFSFDETPPRDLPEARALGSP